jgi:ATP-dependent DNA helicase RecQ
VLKGTQQVQLRKDPHPVKSKKSLKQSSRKDLAFEDEAVKQLFEKLRLLRLEIARQLELPPFVVFHDKTLKEMAILRPTSRTAMLQITGVGEQKLQRYGDRFLDAIKKGVGNAINIKK